MGVTKTIMRYGNGQDKPNVGDEVTLEYVGFIYDIASGARGAEIDSSDYRGEFITQIGTGQLIKGFDEGVVSVEGGMFLGEKATFIITSDYGYGERGFPGRIPPGSSLIFEVELIAINDIRAE